ncbi:hypothetical protein GQ53DRAFT_598089, partial [Thozetella sp. PMI_491]
RDRGHDSDTENEDDQREFKKQKSRHIKNREGQKYLACPFWKLDYAKYNQCLTKKLTTIGYVKQHLYRKHTADFYCDYCLVVFEDKNAYDYHRSMARDQCRRDPSATFEGVSYVQHRMLTRKSKGKLEEQWFAIWDILFEQKSRPASIFVDFDQSPDFCEFREYCERNGVPIVLDALETTGLTLRASISD